MKTQGLIKNLPRELKLLIAIFSLVLSVGFYSGLLFVKSTSSMQATGVEQNYLGNEYIEDAKVMKFKKSKKEMLSIVHTHVLSMAMIFFLTGILLALCDLPYNIKLFLMIEPFFSVILTFGGIYLLWKELLWMKYIIMFSGTLMTLSFSVSIFIILFQLSQKNKLISFNKEPFN